MENFIYWSLGFIVAWFISWLLPTIYLVCEECDYDYENNLENEWIRKLRWIPVVNLVFCIIAILLCFAIIYLVIVDSIDSLKEKKRNARRNKVK